VLAGAQLKSLRWLVGGLMLCAVGLGVVVGVTLPRTLAYDDLLDENMTLKGQIQQIDDKTAEVDRILMRLRLYDAQLKSLEPEGEHGPLPADASANARLIEAHDHLDGLGQSEGPVIVPDDLRPAEAWAVAVMARVDTFVQLFEESETDLNELVGELEDLRALKEALPGEWPAHGQLTSGFGFRRSPFGRWRTDFHSGIDIADRRGAPIFAAATGRVIRADYSGGYGRMVELDHGFGITTRYAHCTSLKVKKGDVVAASDLIATMGSSGRVTGPHLHFEVRIDGHAVDPLDYLPR
jgi:murein DD-endopeptidase MepM/ murein hydrolase activator NlpD